MEARLAKERQERVDRAAGYDYDKAALRQEFGGDTELDELVAAGGLVGSGGEHARHEPWREHGLNAGALVGAAQFQDPRDVESHVETTNRVDRVNELREWL